MTYTTREAYYWRAPYAGIGVILLGIGGLLLAIAFPWLGYRLYKRATKESVKEALKETAEDPLKILKSRLAKGEITEKEYKKIKEALE